MTHNKMNSDRRPGDFLLDRYLPDAAPEEREAAREEFKHFIHAVLKVAMRIAKEDQAFTDKS